MPLIPSIMQQGFLQQFQTARMSGAAQAAHAFAQAYFNYAVTASCVYGTFIPTGTEVLRLQGCLVAAMGISPGSAVGLASAWGTGLQAFWAGAIFGLGAATVIVGLPILVGQVTAALSNPQNTAETAASFMATALDVGTRTLLIGGPSGPVPVV